MAREPYKTPFEDEDDDEDERRAGSV